jgi:hypothetical protein
MTVSENEQLENFKKLLDNIGNSFEQYKGYIDLDFDKHFLSDTFMCRVYQRDMEHSYLITMGYGSFSRYSRCSNPIEKKNFLEISQKEFGKYLENNDFQEPFNISFPPHY